MHAMQHSSRVSQILLVSVANSLLTWTRIKSQIALTCSLKSLYI